MARGPAGSGPSHRGPQPRDAPEQTDLFTDYRRLDTLRSLDRAVDGLCARYGARTVRRLGAALPEDMPREKCSFADR